MDLSLLQAALIMVLCLSNTEVTATFPVALAILPSLSHSLFVNYWVYLAVPIRACVDSHLLEHGEAFKGHILKENWLFPSQ